MSSCPRSLRSVMRMLDSCEMQDKSRKIVTERAGVAQAGVVALPYAYNRHPEMREHVLIYYLVQEFLESMQMYNTLAVFSRESAFDTGDYAEYHPIMGMEWFLKSFFMGDRYDGLLPIVLRFYKSACKRVLAKRRKNEALEDMVNKAEMEEEDRLNREKKYRSCPLVMDKPRCGISHPKRRINSITTSCSNPICPQKLCASTPPPTTTNECPLEDDICARIHNDEPNCPRENTPEISSSSSECPLEEDLCARIHKGKHTCSRNKHKPPPAPLECPSTSDSCDLVDRDETPCPRTNSKSPKNYKRKSKEALSYQPVPVVVVVLDKQQSNINQNVQPCSAPPQIEQTPKNQNCGMNQNASVIINETPLARSTPHPTQCKNVTKDSSFKDERPFTKSELLNRIRKVLPHLNSFQNQTSNEPSESVQIIEKSVHPISIEDSASAYKSKSNRTHHSETMNDSATNKSRHDRTLHSIEAHPPRYSSTPNRTMGHETSQMVPEEFSYQTRPDGTSQMGSGEFSTQSHGYETSYSRSGEFSNRTQANQTSHHASGEFPISEQSAQQESHSDRSNRTYTVINNDAPSCNQSCSLNQNSSQPQSSSLSNDQSARPGVVSALVAVHESRARQPMDMEFSKQEVSLHADQPIDLRKSRTACDRGDACPIQREEQRRPDTSGQCSMQTPGSSPRQTIQSITVHETSRQPVDIVQEQPLNLAKNGCNAGPSGCVPTDPALGRSSFLEGRPHNRPRANSVTAGQKKSCGAALTKANVTFHEMMEGAEVREDFRDKYLKGYRPNSPAIVIDGQDQEGAAGGGPNAEDEDSFSYVERDLIPMPRSPASFYVDPEEEMWKKVEDMLAIASNIRGIQCDPVLAERARRKFR